MDWFETCFGARFNRRYATDSVRRCDHPWDQSHGYHHGVATRRIRFGDAIVRGMNPTATITASLRDGFGFGDAIVRGINPAVTITASLRDGFGFGYAIVRGMNPTATIRASLRDSPSQRRCAGHQQTIALRLTIKPSLRATQHQSAKA